MRGWQRWQRGHKWWGDRSRDKSKVVTGRNEDNCRPIVTSCHLHSHPNPARLDGDVDSLLGTLGVSAWRSLTREDLTVTKYLEVLYYYLMYEYYTIR